MATLQPVIDVEETNDDSFDLSKVFPNVLKSLYRISQDENAPFNSRVAAGRVLTQYQVVNGDHIKINKNGMKLLQRALLKDDMKKTPPLVGELPGNYLPSEDGEC